MSSAKSSLKLFIMYRYFFLYTGIVTLFIMIPYEFSSVQFFNWLVFAVISALLFIISSKLVFRATVSKEDVQLGNERISWSDVKTIKRVLQLYFLRTKEGRIYLFPIERDPIRIFGDTISETDMDQIVELVKRKYHI